MVKLNIGAGVSYIPDFINIDISSRANVVMDIGKEKLPFEDSSVDVIFSYHTLEHIPEYLFALSEMHRVLKHGGVLLLGVPYITETNLNLVNPYHVNHFNEFSFDFFDPKKFKGSAAETNPILFKKGFHRLHYIGIFKFLPPPLNIWARRHLLNIVRKIDYGLIAVKQDDANTLFKYPSSRELKEQFLACTKARILYEPDPRTQSGLFRVARGVWRWWGGNTMEV